MLNLPTQTQIETANDNLTNVSFPYNNTIRMRIGITCWAEISLSKSGKRLKCHKRYVNSDKTDWISETTYLIHWQQWVKNI